MSTISRLLQKFKPGNSGRLARLLKNLGITFGENVLSRGLNFLIILILTRMLGPEDYGRYSFIFVTAALCSALFDFGMENTAVRFAARDKDRRLNIFGLYLVVKLAILIGLALFFALFGEWLLAAMGKEAVAQYIPFLILGLLGESLFLVNDTWLQANQQFRLRALMNVSRYLISLAYIGALLGFGALSLDGIFCLYLVPIGISLVFFRQYAAFTRAWLRERMQGALFAEVAKYQRWMLIYSIGNNLLSRVDFFMLSFWVGFEQLGIYNAAFQLCSVVGLLPFALGKVLLPALSELPEDEVFRTTGYVARATTLAALATALLTPLSHWVVPLLLGEKYAASVPVLQILLLAFIGGLITMPYEQALYSLGKPRVLSIMRYAQLGLMILLNLVAIPLWGIYGAAATMLAGRVIYLVLIRQYYRNYASDAGARNPAYATAGS